MKIAGGGGTVQGVGEEIRAAPNVAVVTTDLGGTIRYWNHGCEQYTGWKRDEVLGRPLVEIVADPDEAPWIEAVLAEARSSGRWEGRVDVQRRDGGRLATRTHATLIYDESGEPSGIAGIVVDVSDTLRLERRLRSTEDHLRTVVSNMVEGLLTFDRDGRLLSLNAAAERMLGYRHEQLAGLIAHDVIHPTGDGGRHSFDECPLLCHALHHQTRTAEDVLLRADGTPLPVSYTAATFRAEDGRCGAAVVFSDITHRRDAEARLTLQLSELRWVERIRTALAEDRLRLHAQPIVDLATGAVAQHELLLRMSDGDGQYVLPGEFLPAAEKHGLMYDIDRWVVQQAIGFAARGWPVELNLSAQSVGSRDLLLHFARELATTGADPSLLVVEITETALLADEDAAKRFLGALKDLGCAVALDDFGTGYGCFTYLKRLPVDFLKIDREFVRDLTKDACNRHVVQAVVDLARGFGQQTVAEGAEDRETLELLASLGVDFVQGYAIAAPAPTASVFGG